LGDSDQLRYQSTDGAAARQTPREPARSPSKPQPWTRRPNKLPCVLADPGGSPLARASGEEAEEDVEAEAPRSGSMSR